MAPRSTFAMEIDWGPSFILKSIKHALSKSRFWRIMGGGGCTHTYYTCPTISLYVNEVVQIFTDFRFSPLLFLWFCSGIMKICRNTTCKDISVPVAITDDLDHGLQVVLLLAASLGLFIDMTELFYEVQSTVLCVCCLWFFCNYFQFISTLNLGRINMLIPRASLKISVIPKIAQSNTSGSYFLERVYSQNKSGSHLRFYGAVNGSPYGPC